MGFWQFGSVRRREGPRRVLLASVDENQHRRAEILFRLRRQQTKKIFPGAAAPRRYLFGADGVVAVLRAAVAAGDQQLGQVPNDFDAAGPSGSTPGYGN